MADIVWTSPKGRYTEITVIPEGYGEETREEKAERLGADFGPQPVVDEETPEEKAERRERALADLDELFREIDLKPTEEDISELNALLEHWGWDTINGDEWLK